MDVNTENRAVLIAGPTASGKSALALKIAEETGGTIINADAMQVYADLRILSARPDEDDEARAPHRLYGHVDGAARYSVGKWLEDAGNILREVWARDDVAIVAGGTGLYFKALEEGLSPVPEISPSVREEISQSLRNEGISALYKRLRHLDKKGAASFEPSDVQRVVRALEVVEETGTPLGEWQKKHVQPLLQNADVCRGYVAVEREELYARCNSRFEKMLDEGAIDEVKVLLARELAKDLPVMKAIGVREIAALLSGECTREEANKTAQMQTRRYAKRQTTWFRGQMTGWPANSSDVLASMFLKFLKR
ncbi:MAG: tRNA (adenosine(37)-N6)-dimethylallyltransferase MiaA [Hyphomicrobiales bacterium]